MILLGKLIPFMFLFHRVLATPRRDILARASSDFNPNDIKDTVCDNPNAVIDNHDMNVALLQICNGIVGKIQKCQGEPTSTQGQSGSALWTLNPVNQGAIINVSKGRWERCIRAAKAVCTSGEFHSTCKGGTSNGDLNFALTAT